MYKQDESLEYFLLRNYKNLGMTTRRILTEMCFASIEKLGTKDSFWTLPKLTEEREKSLRQTRSMIQLEIISKIMFIIEDLVIIGEALRQKKSYYSLLKGDVGKLVGNFVNNLDKLSDDELCKIMSYKILNETNTDKNCLDLLRRHTKINLDEIRRALKMICDFGKQHHPVFKRFKHAGIPFVPGLPMQNFPDFQSFDSHMLVQTGDDPLNDLKIIPYSKNVLEGYKIVYNSAQKLVYDMVENRLACIQRKVDGLITQDFYDITKYSNDDIQKIKNKIEKFYKEHPTVNTDFEFHSNPVHNRRDYSWYLDLDKFLDECEKNAKAQTEYQQKLKEQGFDVSI